MTPIRIDPGATSRSVYVRILKDDGKANTTPLVYNSANLAVSYVRDNASAVAIALATLASATAAYSSGGFVHVSNGVYRLDLPNAAIASGASLVSIIFAEATDIRADALLIDLTARLEPTVVGRKLGLDTAGRPTVDVYSIGTFAVSSYAGAGFNAMGEAYNTNSRINADAVRWGGSLVGGMPHSATQQTADMSTIGGWYADSITAINTRASASSIATLHTADQAAEDVQQTAGLLGDVVTAVMSRASQASITTLTTAVGAIHSLDAAGVRAAMGLSTANLDVQIAGLAGKVDDAIDAADAATQAAMDAEAAVDTLAGSLTSTVGNVATLISRITAGRAAALDHLDANVSDAIAEAQAATQAAMDTETAVDTLTTTVSGIHSLDAAGVRAAVGLSAANLGTQLAGLAGKADAAIDAADAATQAAMDAETAVDTLAGSFASTSGNVATLVSRLTAGRAANLDKLDKKISDIVTGGGGGGGGTIAGPVFASLPLGVDLRVATKLTVTQHAACRLPIEVFGVDRSPVALAGLTLRFVIFDDNGIARGQIDADRITVDDESTNRCYVDLLPAETGTSGQRRWTLWDRTDATKPRSLGKGPFVVELAAIGDD